MGTTPCSRSGAESPSTTGFGRFDLAYFRHTDKWFTVYPALTAAECFREIGKRSVLAHELTAARRAFVPTKPHTIDDYLAGLSAENRAAPRKVRRSFHPMSGDTVATLKADLAGYDTSRGTIRFSARAGLPATLVRKLVKTRIAEG
jgi:hypothetical protein